MGGDRNSGLSEHHCSDHFEQTNVQGRQHSYSRRLALAPSISPAIDHAWPAVSVACCCCCSCCCRCSCPFGVLRALLHALRGNYRETYAQHYSANLWGTNFYRQVQPVQALVLVLVLVRARTVRTHVRDRLVAW